MRGWTARYPRGTGRPPRSGYVTRDAPKGRVARFIRWVQRGRKARRVIATRYVPVAAAMRGLAS